RRWFWEKLEEVCGTWRRLIVEPRRLNGVDSWDLWVDGVIMAVSKTVQKFDQFLEADPRENAVRLGVKLSEALVGKEAQMLRLEDLVVLPGSIEEKRLSR